MLSKRLQKVFEFIDINDFVADIGCDHGYLAKELVINGATFVQLVDNKVEPLNVAKKNLKEIEHMATIEYTLADGLSKINEKVNVVAICGMGGNLIANILKENIAAAKKMKYLVLEANSKVEVLREFLNNSNFIIEDEEIVFDKDKYYEVIKTSFKENTAKLSKRELLYGPINLKKRSNTFINYIKYKILQTKKLIEKNFDGDVSKLIEKEYELINILNDKLELIRMISDDEVYLPIPSHIQDVINVYFTKVNELKEKKVENTAENIANLMNVSVDKITQIEKIILKYNIKHPVK